LVPLTGKGYLVVDGIHYSDPSCFWSTFNFKTNGLKTLKENI